MEQPPGSLDDLQPQDLSTSSIRSVVDLTKKASQNVMSCNVQRLIHMPDWHPNSGLLETTSSNASHQSVDQIQPDNALSHTTVTLSYVSRSHIYSSSQPLTGLQPIRKFSLIPSCEAETAYTLNQHYLEPIGKPVDLATKSFHSLSKPPEIDVVYLPQQLCELNGAVNLSTTIREEHSERLENGQHDSCSSSVVATEMSPETPMTVLSNDESGGSSETPPQIFKNEEQVVAENKMAAIELCSLTKDYKSPLEDPVSPSATSVEDVFMLPLTSSSPSGENSFRVDAVAWDEGAVELRSGIDNAAKSFDSSDENGQKTERVKKTELTPVIDLTEDGCLSRISEDKPKTVTPPHENGNVSPIQTTLQERKLPFRSNRGVRLESFIMNLSSTSYKVSGCINANIDVSKMATWDSYATNLKRNVRKSKAKQKAVSHCKKGQTNSIKTNHCQSTTSNRVNNSRKSNRKSPKFTKSTLEDTSRLGHLTSPVKSNRKHCLASSLRSNSSKKLVQSKLEKNQATPPACKVSPKSQRSAAKTKVAPTPKKRRKKHKPKPFSSIFAPKEPEIKLKYIHYREERKDFRYDNFSPFIRVHRKRSSTSLCSVVNYPEEGKTPQNRAQRELTDNSGNFISETVPSSSCLHLGRRSTQGQHRDSLVCCLCGLSANAMDLGDLHGPYYPAGYKPSTKESACSPTLKGDTDCDSDSSSCSDAGRRRKRAFVPSSWSHKPANQRWQKSYPLSRHRTADNTGSPAAKRACSEMWNTDGEDWYSPPVLPLDSCEYWLHEDCGIWSAGVFLVKGRIYGLVESVKVAQEMMCSACSAPGATLGCFFKGCPSKYHYRCALEADCVLIEENFSMKCKKHKNKTFKAPVGMHKDPSGKRPS
ncbi:retinoic acid-induced protein 1 [Corythoichthys intestinalis]|uniref:retinoic acid-induced protein 1 n=1 Tax=Corythoichthys intestinalis TaxID=161448 RepID=UPI0025A50C42|nr:retinoic acid-induced protein 1 [Corythoichthys intestinalis]